ncbi:MAG: hypothetical protein V4515_00105 [Chloroflexota bacterium]
MRKADLIAGVNGKPTPFEVEGFAVHLRPLTAADRLDLFRWHKEHKGEPTAANDLQHKLIALAVVDPESGDRLLSEKEAADLAAVAVDAISEEVARRNGMGNDDAGKASRPIPSSPESAESA